MAELDEDGWERWWASREAVWGGLVSGPLVAAAGGLAPGRALDVGCGEGADALWLAEHGWQVLAVDVSASALRRGKAQAVSLGRAVAARVMWMRADAMTWSGLDAPPERPAGRAARFETRFDLVSAQFLPVAAGGWGAVLARLGGVVVPGGSLLVGNAPVASGPADPGVGVGAVWGDAGTRWDAGELSGFLDVAEWEVLVARGGVLHARRRVH